MYADGHREAAHEVHHSIGDTGIRILASGFILVGLISFYSNFNDNQDISKTAAWPTTVGKLEEIGSTQVVMPILDKFVPIICPYAKYSYVIDNKNYTGQKNGGPCLSIIRDITFRKPEVEKVKKPESEEKKKQHHNKRHGLFFNGFNGNRFNRNGQQLQQQNENQQIYKREPVLTRETDSTTKTSSVSVPNATAKPSNDPVYKPIRVRYDKDHVENSLIDPAVLQTENSQLFTSIAFVLVGGIFLLGNILNGYMAKAASEDPLLSLDNALAHQKQSRTRR